MRTIIIIIFKRQASVAKFLIFAEYPRQPWACISKCAQNARNLCGWTLTFTLIH